MRAPRFRTRYSTQEYREGWLVIAIDEIDGRMIGDPRFAFGGFDAPFASEEEAQKAIDDLTEVLS